MVIKIGLQNHSLNHLNCVYIYIKGRSTSREGLHQGDGLYQGDGLSQGGGLHQGGLHQWPRGRSASPPNYAAIACILITTHYKRESAIKDYGAL